MTTIWARNNKPTTDVPSMTTLAYLVKAFICIHTQVYFDFNNGAKNKTKKQIVTSVQFSFRHSDFARMFVSFINVCIFLFFSFFL